MHAKTELPMYQHLQELGLGFTPEEEYQQHHNHFHAQLQKEEEFLPQLYDLNQISFICNSESSFGDDQYYHHFSNQNHTARTPAVSDYDLGGEGELFKAPKPIMDPKDPFPASAHHQFTAATYTLPHGEDDNLNTETVEDGKMDLLEMTVIAETFPELADMEFPTLDTGEDQPTAKDELAAADGPLQKSVSCECLLGGNERSSEGSLRSSTVEFQVVDLGAALRRAYSEADMETLRSGDAAVGRASFGRPSTYERLSKVDDVKMEERRQKLSRYRKKKTRRNFDRKIKYACRKALADNQPRVQGRFARTQGGKASN